MSVPSLLDLLEASINPVLDEDDDEMAPPDLESARDILRMLREALGATEPTRCICPSYEVGSGQDILPPNAQCPKHGAR